MLVSFKRVGCPLCRIRSIRDDSVGAWNLRSTLMTVTNYTLHGTKKPVWRFHFKKRNRIFWVTVRIGVHRRMKVGGPAAYALAVSVTRLWLRFWKTIFFFWRRKLRRQSHKAFSYRWSLTLTLTKHPLPPLDNTFIHSTRRSNIRFTLSLLIRF